MMRMLLRAKNLSLKLVIYLTQWPYAIKSAIITLAKDITVFNQSQIDKWPLDWSSQLIIIILQILSFWVYPEPWG